MKKERTKKTIRRRRRARANYVHRRAASRRPASPLDVLARVRMGIAIVRALAARMARLHPIDANEAAACGNVGLLQAARSFRPQSGVPFAAWAAIRIRGAILDGVRLGSRFPRRPFVRRGDAETKLAAQARHHAGMVTAREMGVVAASALLRDELTPSPEQALVDAEQQAAVRRAMTLLTPIERSMVEHHYFGGKTLEEASQLAGVSKSWGSRAHANALRRLRGELTRAERTRRSARLAETFSDLLPNQPLRTSEPLGVYCEG